MVFNWYSAVIIDDAQVFSLNLFAFISAAKFITVYESAYTRPVVSDAKDEFLFNFDMPLNFSSFSVSLHKYIIVSWDHRIIRVGRHPWNSSSLNPLQGRVTLGRWFGISRERESTSSLGNLAALCDPLCKEVLPHV